MSFALSVPDGVWGSKFWDGRYYQVGYWSAGAFAFIAPPPRPIDLPPAAAPPAPSFSASPVLSIGQSVTYANEVVVAISGQGVILYTLDGSDPRKNGKLYGLPLEITRNVTLSAVCVTLAGFGPIAKQSFLRVS